jgi:hypothetical protein
MKYARYISETQIAFPPANKYVGGVLVLGYNLRTDLLVADGYKPYVEDALRPPAGFVVDAWQYVDDGSAIRKVWSYKPSVPEDAQLTTMAIIRRIAAVVVKYNAIEDVKAIEDINIESLLALAEQKGVTDEDMAALKGDIVMLKTDLEGKMDANWYQIWNSWLKGAITEAMRHIEEALQSAAVAENPQEPTEGEQP